MIPPKQNAAFVAAMEDVLELYRRPYDERFPVVCMDEQPVQLVKETRVPLPPRPARPRRYDHHLRTRRHGVRFSLHRTPWGLAPGERA